MFFLGLFYDVFLFCYTVTEQISNITHQQITHNSCAFEYSHNLLQNRFTQQQEPPLGLIWFLWLLLGIIIFLHYKSLYKAMSYFIAVTTVDVNK